jgi:CDP-glycerol glycerophosphotransferase (TagB/SpsB family)
MNSIKNSKIHAIWITKDKKIVEQIASKGYEVYYQRSLKGIWYALIAGVYVFDNYSKDISFLCSGRAKKINLWHGIPLKKIQMDNKFDLVRHPESNWKRIYWSLRRLSDEKPSHYVLTTSRTLAPTFSSAFKTENVLIANYPRNDNLIEERFQSLRTAEEQSIVDIIDKRMNGKVILYMPTFRESESKFFDVIDISRLNLFLEEEDILLLVKVHPKSKLKKKFEDISSAHIYNISAEADPYSFLGKVDALITDYSSIYFDFLLTDKPIIFFDYDRKDYLSQSRELYYDYDSYTPGKKVKTMEELLYAIKDLNADDVKWKDSRERIRKEVFQNADEFGSEHLYQQVKGILHLK